mmetsp:Transcript_7719/g.23377  ORF Transcript_7719/g.23377 Transcript_7719/m.23377 type:complete len:253 (+) Transcript_7719:104-862(+)
MEAFVGVARVDVRRQQRRAARCGRQRTTRCAEDRKSSADINFGVESMKELDMALKSVQKEAERMERAAKHLRKVEKELRRTASVLQGECDGSSSSSSDEEDKERAKREKKERKKLAKMEKKRLAEERTKRRDARLLDVEVCTGKACSRNGASELLQSVHNFSEDNVDVGVESCSCMGMCKGQYPTVSVNGNKHKESPEATMSRLRMELNQREENAAQDTASLINQEIPRGPVVITGLEPTEAVVAKLFAGLD